MGCGCSKLSAVSAGTSSVAVSKDVIGKKIQQAEKTRVLALRECGLKELPKALADADGAPYFRTVDLSVNKLVSLPDFISSWTAVQTLLCTQNSLVELPTATGRLESLQKLDVSNNQLRSLPAELAALGKLKILFLSGNSLGPLLPDVFGGGSLLDSLEELDLSGNGLQVLSPSLGELRALLRLFISDNSVEELPSTFIGLSKLQHLDAANNKLKGVPPELLERTSLSELWLKGNPIDRLQLQETPGFAVFMERRKERLDKTIGSNVVNQVDLAVCGLD